jgi:hypothetical protein
MVMRMLWVMNDDDNVYCVYRMLPSTQFSLFYTWRRLLVSVSTFHWMTSYEEDLAFSDVLTPSTSCEI